uniref:Uncharacterized protein n=1 Tax=Ananas comosus var. bracteatus TaxID=296719 RepID=A0A6V7PXM9_ANACO|nr:unnamed protein product [Ananas comosus var. bracteatus]
MSPPARGSGRAKREEAAGLNPREPVGLGTRQLAVRMSGEQDGSQPSCAELQFPLTYVEKVALVPREDSEWSGYTYDLEYNCDQPSGEAGWGARGDWTQEDRADPEINAPQFFLDGERTPETHLGINSKTRNPKVGLATSTSSKAAIMARRVGQRSSRDAEDGRGCPGDFVRRLLEQAGSMEMECPGRERFEFELGACQPTVPPSTAKERATRDPCFDGEATSVAEEGSRAARPDWEEAQRRSRIFEEFQEASESKASPSEDVSFCSTSRAEGDGREPLVGLCWSERSL